MGLLDTRCQLWNSAQLKQIGRITVCFATLHHNFTLQLFQLFSSPGNQDEPRTSFGKELRCCLTDAKRRPGNQDRFAGQTRP
jgi:hypothetical protein